MQTTPRPVTQQFVRQTLRPYQTRAIKQVKDALRSGKRRILLVAPTGSGKTTIAAEIIHGAMAKGSDSMFLAHRKELLDQCSNRLDEWSVEHGIIQGNHPRWRPKRLTQVASVDTLRNRIKSKRWQRQPSLFVIDEAHRSTAPSYMMILEWAPDAVVLGLTATPCRLNGRGLADIYDEMVIVAQPSELVEEGWILEPVVYAPENPELVGVHVRGGDFVEKELQIAVDKPKLIGGIVRTYLEIVGRGKRSVFFASGIAHSNHIKEELEASGIRAAHLDGKTPKLQREATLAALKAGEIEAIANVGILTEGWDLPELDAVVMARPTQSLSLYLQMCGRALRPHRGKEQAILLDHAGNTDRHGWPTCERDWDLQTGQSKNQPPPLKNCPRCGFVLRASARTCEACEFEFKVLPRDGPEEVEGKLALRRPPTKEEMEEHLLEAYIKAKRHRMKVGKDGFPGFASHSFRERFRRWPTKAEKTKARNKYRQTSFTGSDAETTSDSGEHTQEGAITENGLFVMAS